MRNNKIFVLILTLVIISSISVTANTQIKQDTMFEDKHISFNDPSKKIRDKIIPDITNYSSIWVEYDDSQTIENNDISNLYYYINPDQTTIQLDESNDLTSLIIQITESTVTNYIQSLVDFGPRRTGTQACTDAGNYIAGVFSTMGLDVRIQQWSASGYSGNNIEATLVGENASSNEVYLVCGHYDSVTGSPGADDNAAGTAAVLASALVMSNYMFSHTVKFVAFSGEEQGLLGSSVYAAEAASQGINIIEVLDADMIAYAETEQDRHTVEIYGSSDNIALESQAINSAYPGLIDLTVIPYGASGNSDHWPFIEEGYDAAMYSEYHFNPYYHSSQDTMDKLDLEYDSRVTRMIMAVLANYSNLIIPDDGGGGGGQYILRPIVNIEDPSNGDYVRGTIDITGKASSFNSFVKYVLVQIDNNDWEYAKIDQTTGSYINWTYSWDTTNVDDGPHLISAAAINNHGADSPTYYSSVNVVNEVLDTNIIMPNQADVNEMITIQSFTIGGLPPYNYTWDLGDGTKKYEQNISYIYKNPGEYKVELTVKDSMNNTAYASKTIQIIDDIPPTISIINPKNAFYLNNNEVFTLKNPVIIGDIDIILDVADNSGINFVILYINNQEKFIFTESPYVWTWDENMFGKATINVVAFDKSGNKANDTINVWKFF
jgi:hypothetical protein